MTIVIILIIAIIVICFPSSKRRCPKCGGTHLTKCYNDNVDRVFWQCNECGKIF